MSNMEKRYRNKIIIIIIIIIIITSCLYNRSQSHVMVCDCLL